MQQHKQHPRRQHQAHIRAILRFLLLCLLLLILTAVSPNRGFAQNGDASPAHSLTLTDEQVDEWLGREAHITHPVIPNLIHREVSTLHFYYETAFSRRAESVMATAGNAKAKTLRFLPDETLSNIHIYLLGDINRYFEAQNSPGRAPAWAAGLAILRDGVILIRLKPGGTARIEPERTLAHELNHIALRRFAHDQLFPHWFYEGFAMLATDDWGLTRAETLARASMSGQLLHLDQLNDAFSKHGAIVDLAYAQSAHFVTWLANTYGDDTLKRLLQNVADGKPFDDAFINAYGRSPRAAYAFWMDNVATKSSPWLSLFSSEGIFFALSFFAALALIYALRKRNKIRKARFENPNQDIPISTLPKNLHHFGPFQPRKPQR